MPRGSSDLPPSPRDTPAGLREMAARARRLAKGVDEQTANKLGEFAQELEARAAALEPAAQTFTHSEAVAVQRSDTDASQG